MNINKVDRGLTLLHEAQHVRISTDVLLSGQTAISGDKQHDIMRSNDSYSNERIRYFGQFRSILLNSLDQNQKIKVDEILKTRSNAGL